MHRGVKPYEPRQARFVSKVINKILELIIFGAKIYSKNRFHHPQTCRVIELALTSRPALSLLTPS